MFFTRNLKQLLVLICNCLYLCDNAQTDTLKHKISFNAVEFSISNFVYNWPALDLNFYKATFVNDLTLKENLNDFKTTPIFYEAELFRQLHSPQIRAVFNFNNKKKYNLEFQLGIKYRQSVIAGLNLYKSDIDTLATIYNSSTGGYLFKIEETETNHHLKIYAQELYIPLSINYYTNKKNRLWLSIGLEAAFGVQFNYLFKNETIQQTYVDYIESGHEFSKNNANYSQVTKSFVSEQKIKEFNPTVYYSVPITLYFKLSKKQAFLKCLNTFINFTPGIYFYNSKIINNVTSSFGFYSLGLRVM